jgi:alpha-1,6-mannosyltransferase
MSNNTKLILAALFFIFTIATCGLLIERHQTAFLTTAYGSGFLSYFFIVRLNENHENKLFYLGIFARLLLFTSLPSLSDDFYRFIWDGSLIHLGIDPYGAKPEDLISSAELPTYIGTLFQNLNSPQYFTVYPPLNQLLFWIATIFGESTLASVNILRFFIVIAEIGSFWLLQKLSAHYQKSKDISLWYFLNPLVILEFTGNLHFEAFVIFFLLLGLYYLTKSNFVKGGLSFGGAIAMKLLPLIFIPALFFHLKRKNGIITISVAFLVVVASLIPLLSTSLFVNIQKSLGLYFQSFEFNASLYYIFREVGFWVKGYNIIGSLGPWLSISSMTIIITISYFGRKWMLPKAMLWVLFTYLICATTVHPWYILPLIPLGLLSGFYFPIVWSILIFVTYVGYTLEGYDLPMYWVVIEYFCLVVFMIFEFKRKK